MIKDMILSNQQDNNIISIKMIISHSITC